MTPSQRAALDHIRNAESSLCRVATLCDIAETRAGRSRVPTFIPPRDYQRIADEVSLALETIALTGRRV